MLLNLGRSLLVELVYLCYSSWNFLLVSSVVVINLDGTEVILYFGKDGIGPEPTCHGHEEIFHALETDGARAVDITVHVNVHSYFLVHIHANINVGIIAGIY